MGKKNPETNGHKNSKAHRLDEPDEVVNSDKSTWPTNAAIYLGHLPYGFQEDQLKAYFSQYGEVLAVKLARSKLTARSKGYAFVQFKYPEVAQIVSDNMNGYLLMGKVIVSNVLPATQKNPFRYATSAQYKYINWRHIFVKQNKEPKTEQQTAHLIHNMLKKQEKRREKFQELGIKYDFPGFAAHIPQTQTKAKTIKKSKK